jgi:hypothetical protein
MIQPTYKRLINLTYLSDMKNLKLYIILLATVCISNIRAQEASRIIQQAMEQSIARNIKNLHLAGMKDPFYIGLDIVDFNMLAIHSTLGALIRVTETPNRVTFNNQVLVGDYNNNNLNFSDPRSMTYYIRTAGMLPFDNSLSEIKHKLWLSFDRAYKMSAENYESKQSALRVKHRPMTLLVFLITLKAKKLLWKNLRFH